MRTCDPYLLSRDSGHQNCKTQGPFQEAYPALHVSKKQRTQTRDREPCICCASAYPDLVHREDRDPSQLCLTIFGLCAPASLSQVFGLNLKGMLHRGTSLLSQAAVVVVAGAILALVLGRSPFSGHRQLLLRRHQRGRCAVPAGTSAGDQRTFGRASGPYSPSRGEFPAGWGPVACAASWGGEGVGGGGGGADKML